MKDEKRELTTPERPYASEPDEILEALQSRRDGLNSDEVEKRRSHFGPNRLPEAEKEGLLYRFFKHFHDILIYILIFAACITAFLEHWVDTAVILGVVVINAIIGFVQEGKAEQALEGIRKMLSLGAVAKRDEEWQEIEAAELVPGDIVRLRSGDRVPADMRLISVTNLRIEESALTGESVPTEKRIDKVDKNAGIGDRFCMAYSGTLVSAGRGVGVVTATGPATELGRINKMIAGVEQIATPLTKQMNQFGKVLSFVIVGIAVGLGAVGYFVQDFEAGELLLAIIGFAVAAIPEGLPAIMTITLALGVQRMARRNAITRRLNAVETLGSVTVICSDKTGTLTKNEMTARHIITRRHSYHVSGTGYKPEGKVTVDEEEKHLDKHGDLYALIEVMAVCNDSEVSESDGEWYVTGEPTEGALQTLAHKVNFDSDSYDRHDVIPFESDNKFMATLNEVPNGKVKILLKGAPDRLLERCAKELAQDGSIQEIEQRFWEDKLHELSGEGLRVLAAAYKDADNSKKKISLSDIEEDMILVGLVGIIDPPRPEAIQAIRSCLDAGIRVKMITGDHTGTAKAIGKEMGIGNGENAVTGAKLESASDEELRSIVEENDVFARTSPEHKLRLVKALQANNQVVAMTGDGVNDAPALKRADVGIAMGIKGTEATKEAAEIVLADDNFTSIEHAVEEGRTIYDNLRKAIIFILPTNGAQSFVVLFAILFGLSLPLTPVQILWVNMVTAVTLALALAFEPAEPGLMKRPPRKPGTSILTGILFWRIAFVSLLIGGATIAVYTLMKDVEESLAAARTLAVNTLVMGQIFYLFNSRFLEASSLSMAHLFTNKAVWIAVGILLLLQGAFVYLPFMQTMFGTTAVGLSEWLLATAIGAAVFIIVEIEKAIIRRSDKSAVS